MRPVFAILCSVSIKSQRTIVGTLTVSSCVDAGFMDRAAEELPPPGAPVGPSIPVTPVTPMVPVTPVTPVAPVAPVSPWGPGLPPVPPPPEPGAPVGPVAPKVLGTFTKEENDKVDVAMEVTVILDPTSVLNPTLFANKLLMDNVDPSPLENVMKPVEIDEVFKVEPVAVENVTIFPAKVDRPITVLNAR